MKKKTNRGLTEAELDIFREIGTIGAGNAATALSQLAGRRVMVDIPDVKKVELEKLPDIVGDKDTPIVGVHFQILGDVVGTTLLVFDEDTAFSILHLLFQQGNHSRIETLFSESAFKEVANILTGTYLNALSQFLGLRMIPSTPKMNIEPASTVAKTAVAHLGPNTSVDVLAIMTVLSIEKKKIAGKFFLIFDVESSKLIMKKIKEKITEID